MEFAQYQTKAYDTAIYPDEIAIVYLTLGLASEAGEVAGKIKKILRDSPPEEYADVLDKSKAALSEEIGDVLWYAANLATELGLDLSAIAQSNLHKLQSRKERGVLSGSGDSR